MRRRREDNKNEKEVEEERIKPLRGEIIKLWRGELKKIEEGKMWWWLYIVSIHQAVLKQN